MKYVGEDAIKKLMVLIKDKFLVNPPDGYPGQVLTKAAIGEAWQNPSDTKNTAGATDTASKIYLVGATEQAANPQTYTQDTAYVGNDGCLYSGGTKVLTSHQTLPITLPCTYVTTAPTAANTVGIKMAVLSSEPSTKYAGWLYIITE